jgi:hypothetical protein
MMGWLNVFEKLNLHKWNVMLSRKLFSEVVSYDQKHGANL